MLRYAIIFASNLLEWYIACLFFGALHPRRFSQKKSLVLGAAILSVQFFGNVFFLGKSVVLTVAIALVIDILLSLLYVSKWGWKLLESVILFVLSSAAEIAFEILIGAALHTEVGDVQSNMVVFATGTFTSKFIVLVIVALFRFGRLRKQTDTSGPVAAPMLLFPIGTILTFLFFALTVDSLQTRRYSVLSTVILLAANIILFRVIEQQSDYIRTKEALRYAKAQLRQQIEHYNALYRYQTETRKLRHDEKNKMLALSGLLQAGDVEQAKTALEREIAAITQAAACVVDTGNPVLDAVLQSKQSDAAQHGIALRIRTQMQEPIGIDVMQLGVLLGNAVDNAIEAVAKIDETAVDRTVDVTLQTRMQRIFVSVQNPTAQESGDVRDLRSDKDDAHRHGFGLQSIRTVAEAYDGTVSISWQDHTFRIEIGLDNRNDVPNAV